MADNILRLRVDSAEYDNKLKRAAEGIQRYADECKKAGGTLEHLDDGVEQFVRELGNMETVSKSAKGSINEMTKAFTDLSVQYNKLTDEEKNSPFGQALKSSLDELKGRIQSGNDEIKNISNSLNGGSGLKDALDQVAGKFGLNVDIITKFGGIVGAATTALKVAKDAFLQSESNIDEWGRTVKGAEGAYDIFLQTLNNGNWSNFFSNLSQAITGARDLYDAFDRLNSIKANNAVAIATTQAEIQQLRLLKQQGQDVDDKIKDATQRLAALQAQSANAGINAGKSQVVNTLRNGVNSIGGASINNATLNRVADNISKQGQAYFDFMKRRAAALEKQGMVTRTQTIMDSQGGTYERQYKAFDINALSKEQQKQYAIAKTVTERETEIQKGLSVWSQSVQEQAAATREQFKGNRYALQGSGGSGGSSGGKGGKGGAVIPAYKMEAIDVSQLNLPGLTPQVVPVTFEVDSSGMNALQKLEAELQNLIEQQKIFGGASSELWQMFQAGVDRATEKIKEFKGQKPMAKMTEDAVESSKGFQQAAQAIGAVTSALNSLEDPGAKIMGIVGQAIAQIALGFAQATAASSGGGIFAWIAAITGGMATMISTIEAIHSATGYANGGEIKGNSYSGDNIPIMANAGEIILNKSQQATLASNLQNGDGGGYKPSYITGEMIWIAANRYTKRTGRGELVTWK